MITTTVGAKLILKHDGSRQPPLVVFVIRLSPKGWPAVDLGEGKTLTLRPSIWGQMFIPTRAPRFSSVQGLEAVPFTDAAFTEAQEAYERHLAHEAEKKAQTENHRQKVQDQAAREMQEFKEVVPDIFAITQELEVFNPDDTLFILRLPVKADLREYKGGNVEVAFVRVHPVEKLNWETRKTERQFAYNATTQTAKSAISFSSFSSHKASSVEQALFESGCALYHRQW